MSGGFFGLMQGFPFMKHIKQHFFYSKTRQIAGYSLRF
ncbi:hypothetical protein BPUTSESOX_2357 [uncultured Gammaproteobacteria bacterium]|nr:hypothetical protein [uncultured Gammaproteobacteria bacterium]CAC9508244.1 hypothetical protein [uncultured Gammaproteobacteria bacterium]CAC9956386.1 hypothetical protein [uncultured Gammaproteobacteria bacterium]CAC9997493.1 hypothetical protein [uncultured Gammaproteobacteria bacterium]VVH50606.1 hypothetical protein BPUTSESOX_2357 [uncultured Gammaproteobacteria bacterium]